MKRIKESIGGYFYNAGTSYLSEINVEKFVVDKSKAFFLFDVVPMGAVRMNRADRWRKRPVVLQYFQFIDRLREQAKDLKFELGKTFNAVYFLPMPDSWSNKKKEKMNGSIHESKPDTDNITKGIKDALRENDSDIWWEKAEKRWAYKGSILIYV
jgi:Holliday junction resolvase RusA-like endonuclease